MVDPDSLAPVMREEWFSASLTISEPWQRGGEGRGGGRTFQLGQSKP